MKQNQIGRSMIEMLGVLAIIGVLSVGGIAGYSKAMMKFKINKTVQQISEIVANVRTLYAQQKNYNGLGTATAVQMGVIPDDLLTDSRGYITNVFGGNVRVESFYNEDNENIFMVGFEGLPEEACVSLATANWGTTDQSGVKGVLVGWLSYGGSYVNFRKGCTEGDAVSLGSWGEGYSSDDGYFACSGRLPISPVNAAKACKNLNEKGDITGVFLIFK